MGILFDKSKAALGKQKIATSEEINRPAITRKERCHNNRIFIVVLQSEQTATVVHRRTTHRLHQHCQQKSFISYGMETGNTLRTQG